MIRKLTITCIALLCSLSIYAQCNFPAPPGSTCSSATFFCNGEVDNFCSTLPSGGAAGPSPLCNGNGVPNNIHWIAFAAGSANISITITPSNCDTIQTPNGINTGVQAGIYSDCTFTNAITCQGVCQSNPFTLSSGSFVVGQVYYIFIDGCGGSVCDYNITVDQGSTISPPPGMATAPTGSTAPCTTPLTQANGYNIFSIPPVTNSNVYVWTITPPSVVFVQNDNMITVTDWAGATSATVCVEAANDCNPATGNSLCTTFSITPVMPVDPAPLSYCENAGGVDYNGTFYSAAGSPYMVNLMSPQGCDSIIELNITELLNTSSQLEATVCVGGCVVVDGQSYCNPLNGIPIPVSTPNADGCDSTVFLTLEILNPMANISGDLSLDCANPTTILFANTSNNPNPGNYIWTYMWSTIDGSVSNGIFDQNILLVDGPGTYELEVTLTTPDGLECTAMAMPVTVTESADFPATSISSTDAPCSGAPTGTATVVASGGGGGPYGYLWDPSAQTTATATGLNAGWYYVTVTSATGCSTVDSVLVNQTTDLPTTSTSSTVTSCSGTPTGTATVVASGGGGGPYGYLWDPSAQTTATATGLPVGWYYVTVTSSNGCMAVDSVEVIETTDFPTTSTSSTVAPCSGPPTGTATVTAMGGGGAPYDYLWNPSGQTSATATGLNAGWYFVTVSGVNGCEVVDSVEVTSSTPVGLSIDNTVDVLCNGASTGSATVSGTAGTPGYSYEWSANAAGQTTATASNLAADIYMVTVTDAAGCTDVETVTINEPPALAFTAVARPAACDGEASGSAYVNPAGGVPGYTYLWNPGGQTMDTAINLVAGLYSVTITDNNNCTQVIDNINVGEPSPITITSTQVDVLCNGEATGTATAMPSGGTMPYTYLWNTTPAQTGPTATGLAAGPYSVIVTDANNCTAQLTGINISQPAAMTASATTTDAGCNGESTGSATITATGSGLLTYTWNPNVSTMATAIGIPADTYSVTVTDANNCTIVVNNIVVGEPDLLTAAVSSSQDIACFGDSTGNVTVQAMGGNGIYTYLWSPGGATTATVNGLPAGTYTVTVTDGATCTAVAFTTLTGPAAALNITEIAVVDASCTSNDGSIDIDVTGGTPGPTGYNYLWTPGGSTDQDPTSLAGGSYTVVVTDDNGCTATFTTTVNIPGGLSATATATPLDCYGDVNSDIDVVVVGGTMPFTYTWSDPAFGNNEDISGVGPGSYIVTVTDNLNCSVQASVNIVEPDSMSIPSVQVIAASCGLMDGSISIFVTGGTGPYSYAWDGGADPNNNPMNLSAGSYTVTITDANMCSKDTTITITTPDGPVLNSLTATNTLCFGDSTGTINLDFTGGQTPFTYDWTGTDFDGIEDPINVPAGTYDLTLTDANNCSFTSSVAVVSPPPLTVTVNTTDALCNGDNTGIAEAVITGGTGPYTFLWCTGQTNGPIIPDCPAGPCSVTITDDNGCTAVENFIIGEPTALSVMIDNVTDVDCNGALTGSISLNVTGGVAPYDYVWNPAAPNSPNPTGLAAGTYAVTITDNNGCSAVQSGILIQEPTVITLTATTSNPDCNMNNGSISVTPMGGNGGYTFAWTGGAGPVSNPSGLGAGIHTVTITDALGCTKDTTFTLITPNGPVLDMITAVDVRCNGGMDGTVSVDFSGGTAPYGFAWNDPIYNGMEDLTGLPAGTYDLTITDANNCSTTGSVMVNEPLALAIAVDSVFAATCGQTNGSAYISVEGGTFPYTYLWSNSDTDQDQVNVLSPGLVDVVVTDANSCTATIQIPITEPGALAVVPTTVDVTCNNEGDGSISLVASGGNGPYTYIWNIPGAGNTNMVSGLDGGNYSVVVRDSDGCIFPIPSIIVEEPDILVENGIVFTAASCLENDGSIDVNFMGGTLPYTYSWTSTTSPFTSNLEDLSGLEPGLYDLLVTDDNGCTTNATGIPVGVPTPPTVTISETPALCFGGTGSALVTVNGANGMVNYTWDDLTIGDTGNPMGLAALNTYQVTVTDSESCTAVASVMITQPDLLVASVLDTEDVLCNGGSDGTITLDIAGGTAGYSYLWSNGSMMQSPDNLLPDDYSVVVTDANGCTAEASATIDEPTLLVLSSTETDTRCSNSDDGTIDITATGGTGAYMFEWSDSQYDGMEDLTGLPPNTYIVTVTDANGCPQELTSVVMAPPAVIVRTEAITDYSGFNVSCANLTDGEITVQGTSGNGAPYTYEWQDGTTTGTLSDLGIGGPYTVTVTDNMGCTEEEAFIMTGPDPIQFAADATPVTCNGDDDGAITVLSPLGGSGPYLYSLDGSPFGQGDFTGLASGNYEVVVQDANGCEASEVVSVNQPTELAVDLGGDITIQLGDSVFLLAQSNSNSLDTLYWIQGLDDLECETCNGQWITPTYTSTYSVFIESDKGCQALDEILIRVNKDRLVYIPSGFSPAVGGSEANDKFMIYGGTGVEKVNQFVVADRWGEIVYQAADFQPGDTRFGWDGTLGGQLLNPGVFVYFAEIEFTDGRIEIYKGDVTLLR